MHPFEAFNKTIERFDIKAIDIANATGKAESYISRYRKGKQDINSATLMLMVRSLPIEAQYYFFSLCMSKENSEDSSNSKRKLAIA